MVVCLSAWLGFGVRSGVCRKCTHGAGTSLRDVGIAIVRKMGNTNGIAGWGAIKQTFDFLTWELIIYEDMRTNP